jgi:hypothetical protein
MHTGKELEVRQIQQGCLSCDSSDAPQVGSARSDSTRVVKGNRHTTNCRTTRPDCNGQLESFLDFMEQCLQQLFIPILHQEHPVHTTPL